MIKYFVVIEPHADDAFISLGGHIEKWVKGGREVLIATAAPQETKRLKEGEEYARKVGAKYLSQGAELNKFIKKTDVQCLLPVGIQHPEHIAIAREYSVKCRNVWRYLDQPYALRQKNEKEVNDKIREAEIVSYLKPSVRKWRHIPVFKTQAKFFYFEEEACHKSFELILKVKKC